MISKIYKATRRLTEMGKGKYKKYPKTSKLYKEAKAMSSLSSSIKRIVTYKKTK
jgi:hypothetical protein